MLWFARKKEVDPDAVVAERYRADFGLFQKSRFPAADADGYSTEIVKHALAFTLFRKNLFSWVPADRFQYRDFIIEAELALPASHSAAGCIFRYNNNENFYSFLVSTRGVFRFDALFNNHPLKIIEWTPSPQIQQGTNTVRVIGRGSHFSFYINDEWVAETSDETFTAGKTGIAAQNYDETDTVQFRYSSFIVDSRSLEVEKAFLRWVRYIPAEPGSRLALAKTLFSMGNFTAAAVQLKKILSAEPGNKEAGMLFSDACINLKLFDEAMAQVDALLAIDRANNQAILQKANLYYLMNRFLEGRDFCLSITGDSLSSSIYWNLLGNCEYALGNWDKACEAYARAVSIDPGMPLFLINQARSLERLGKTPEAAQAYLSAAEILFREEAYSELEVVFPRIIALAPDTDKVKALEAKMLFNEDKLAEAKPLLAELVGKKHEDSAIYFLYGLALNGENKRLEALPCFEQAVEKSPDYAMYWWRLAECKRLLDMEYQFELDKAFELAPEDPWVNNLFGLYYMDSGDLYKAEQYLLAAISKAPGETDIIANLTEILFLQKRHDDAFRLLEDSIGRRDDARLYNLRGNFHVRKGDFPKAVADYEDAIKLTPRDPLFRENCAAACIEADMYTRAEEILVGLLEESPSAHSYNLLGNLSVIRGEFTRAQLCYEQALAFTPNDVQVKVNLAALFADKLDYNRAKTLLDECLLAKPDHPTALALAERLRRQFEVSLECAECGRTWWVGKNLPPQELGKVVGEPPAEAPAGKCPACGKIYCISCAEHHLRDKRFFCPDCDQFLKLSDDQLKFLLLEYMRKDIVLQANRNPELIAPQDRPGEGGLPAPGAETGPAIFKPE